MKKLLIVGSDTIHTYNYLLLIEGYFDEILLITNAVREGYSFPTKVLDFSLNVSTLFQTCREIRKQIREFQPTIIHIHQANSFAFYTLLASRRWMIPVVLTAWGSDVLLLPKKSFLLKRMVQFNLAKADFHTSDSVFMGEEMRRLCPKVREVLIANFGIGIVPKAIEKENIIYSNRLHKKLYRIDEIIKAFQRFLNNTPSKDWKLVIAATGDQTESLKELVIDLGIEKSVQFVGWVDQKENALWYSKSTLWVSIPESDATSISLLEAMASGCIPIVSDLQANKEWIANGRNGVIVDDLQEDFFSAALLLDFEKIQLENLKRIELDGTKEANMKKFIKLYAEIENQKW
jgi:L-malate glycosyltransferase